MAADRIPLPSLTIQPVRFPAKISWLGFAVVGGSFSLVHEYDAIACHPFDKRLLAASSKLLYD